MAPPTGPVSCLVIPWCSLFNGFHHASLCYFSGSLHSHQKANPGQSVQLPGYYIHQDYSGMVNFNRYVGNAKCIGAVSSLYFHMARRPGLVSRNSEVKAIHRYPRTCTSHSLCSFYVIISKNYVSSKSMSSELAVFAEIPSHWFWYLGSLSAKDLIFANKSLSSN